MEQNLAGTMWTTVEWVILTLACNRAWYFRDPGWVIDSCINFRCMFVNFWSRTLNMFLTTPLSLVGRSILYRM